MREFDHRRLVLKEEGAVLGHSAGLLFLRPTPSFQSSHDVQVDLLFYGAGRSRTSESSFTACGTRLHLRQYVVGLSIFPHLAAYIFPLANVYSASAVDSALTKGLATKKGYVAHRVYREPVTHGRRTPNQEVPTYLLQHRGEHSHGQEMRTYSQITISKFPLSALADRSKSFRCSLVVPCTRRAHDRGRIESSLTVPGTFAVSTPSKRYFIRS